MAGSTLASFTARVAAGNRRSDWHPSPHRQVWERFRRHRLAVAGLVFLAAMTVTVAVGPLMWDVPVNEIDLGARLAVPSYAHPLGTDDLGQDLLARILHGGRISLTVGVAATVVAIGIGIAAGAVSGSLGGSVDAALMWLTDLFLSLPQLPLLLLVIYLFGEPLRHLAGPETAAFVLIVAVIGGALDAGGAARARAVSLTPGNAVYRRGARARG